MMLILIFYLGFLIDPNAQGLAVPRRFRLCMRQFQEIPPIIAGGASDALHTSPITIAAAGKIR
jgi:hypothetical protein